MPTVTIVNATASGKSTMLQPGGEGIDGSVARRKDTRGTKQDIDGHKTQGNPFPLSVRSGKWLNAIGQSEILLSTSLIDDLRDWISEFRGLP